MSIRQLKEEREREFLGAYAVLSTNSKGRARPEDDCPVRTCFERDRDRILHCKSFRRLKMKTQVFIYPEDDHYRTRLTHTLEVSQIARTIASALSLNESLAEAIALGHDLGHTPFGHTGEDALNEVCPFSFEHNLQSLRIVERLENGSGLNLTWEVRDGIANHCSGYTPQTLEGKVVYVSDKIAYINHDLEDALAAGVISAEDVPARLTRSLGESRSERINTMIVDVVENSSGIDDIRKSEAVSDATNELRAFLFERVYVGSAAKREEEKAKKMVQSLYGHFLAHPQEMPPEYLSRIDEDGPERVVCDYVAGMTDNYAIKKFMEIFIPKSWDQS